MKRRMAAVVAVLILAIGGLTMANAASLTVSAGSMSTATAAPCVAQLALTRTDPVFGGLFGYNSVTVMAVPATCAGLPLSLTVYRPSGGAVIATGSVASLPTGNVRVPVSATYGGIFGGTYTFALTINGWSVPVTA